MHVLLLGLPVVVSLGDPGGQEDPAPLAAHAWRDVELTEYHHRRGAQARLLAQLARREVGGWRFVAVERARGRALRELPAAQPDRIPELFDEPEAVGVSGDHQRIGRLVDHAVDSGTAVLPADVVLPDDHPRVPVNLP
jgi:hypothetical protein